MKKIQFKYQIGDIVFKNIKADSESIYIVRCKIIALWANNQDLDENEESHYVLKFLDASSEDLFLSNTNDNLECEDLACELELFRTEKQAFIYALKSFEEEEET